MKRCLACFGPVESGEYHSACCRKVFGIPAAPVCDLRLDALPQWALQELGGHQAIPGVQRKISAHWSTARTPLGQSRRLTMVGALGGRFILKPESPDFAHMPWNEALTMALARKFGITTAPSALLRLADGSWAYIVQRFDRTSHLDKIPCEDMAQLTGTLTEDKYRASLEKIGEAISRWSAQPGVDNARLFALAVFCFLTGNGDMHLKNFSLLQSKGRNALSPAYDLLNTKLYLPIDEDSALSVNGKRKRLRRADFEALARHLGVADKFKDRLFWQIPTWWQECQGMLDSELVPAEIAEAYAKIVQERMAVFAPKGVAQDTPTSPATEGSR